jgi:histone arginine demethylase JMJD6
MQTADPRERAAGGRQFRVTAVTTSDGPAARSVRALDAHARPSQREQVCGVRVGVARSRRSVRFRGDELPRSHVAVVQARAGCARPSSWSLRTATIFKLGRFAMEVQRISCDEAGSFYEQFVLPGLPAVVRGAATWPALGKWSTEFFRSRHGQHHVRVGQHTFSLADLMDRVDRSSIAAPAPYLRELAIDRELPALLEDISPVPVITRPNWVGGDVLPRRWGCYGSLPQLLIGGRGSGFPVLHYDQFCLHAFITQIVGSKEFVLFPPSDAPFLYPSSYARNLSELGDVKRVDLARFPLFRHATPIRFRAGPGETVFIPYGWWHVTYLDETSIAVSHNVANASNWRAMTDDMVRTSPRLKRALKRAFLGTLGTALRHAPRAVSAYLRVA